jgi:xylulokinase
MYSIGYDIGSSTIKAALIETVSGKRVALTSEPKT